MVVSVLHFSFSLNSFVVCSAWVSWGGNSEAWLFVNIHVKADWSNLVTSPWEIYLIVSLSSAKSLKHDNVLVISWSGLQWHIVVEAREENVIIAIIVIIFPILPGAGVLSSGNEKQITGLEENTFSFVFLNLASVIQVNKDYIGSVESDTIQ